MRRAATIGFLLAGCSDACIRNSDCTSGLVCAVGNCVVPVNDADLALDGASDASTLDDAQVAEDASRDAPSSVDAPSEDATVDAASLDTAPDPSVDAAADAPEDAIPPSDLDGGSVEDDGGVADSAADSGEPDA